jgi:hypothetical protein
VDRPAESRRKEILAKTEQTTGSTSKEPASYGLLQFVQFQMAVLRCRSVEEAAVGFHGKP